MILELTRTHFSAQIHHLTGVQTRFVTAAQTHNVFPEMAETFFKHSKIKELKDT
jgi:hypothetical protein